MRKTSAYVYVCPSCGATTRALRSACPPGKFRDTVSLVDGRSYPSCRQVEQLCYWCELEKWGDKESLLLPLPRRSAGAGNSGSSTSRPLAAGLLLQYSELWAFLTTQRFEDGTKRLTGSLSLSCASGILGLSLSDTETGQYAFLQGNDLDVLLLEAEGRLGDGTMPWKASRYPGRKK